jgi:hypothetical protein
LAGEPPNTFLVFVLDFSLVLLDELLLDIVGNEFVA